MRTTRRLLATIPYHSRSVAAAVLGFLVASALCVSTAWSADGAVKARRAPAVSSLPPCNHPAVFARIEAEYYSRHWASGVAIADIRAWKSIRKYWPQDMPQHFCEGIIIAPGGATRPIYYAIIPDVPGYRLEWCVLGLDRQWAYDARCRLARP